MSDPTPPEAKAAVEPLPPDVPLFDEDGALSRQFLLHRGYCCKNGCRNCPYGFRQPAPEQQGASGQG